MKKFILGFVCGVIVTVVAAMGFGYYAGSRANSSNGDMPGLTMIENGETIPCKQVRIFQVLRPNRALAYLTNYPEKNYDSEEIVVLYVGDEKDNFYDEQKINVPEGKFIRRVGTFTYPAKNSQKTVPAVELK